MYQSLSFRSCNGFAYNFVVVVPLGSELCLPLAELNEDQVATVIPGPDGNGPQKLDVVVTASEYSGNCAVGIGYRALVTLGTKLPPGVLSSA
jgi:hypothetical protein